MRHLLIPHWSGLLPNSSGSSESHKRREKTLGRRKRRQRRVLESLENRQLLTIFVDAFDTEPDGGGCGSFANPCDTIQMAVDVAPAGGHIYIEGAHYEENVTITKSLSIQGEPGAVSITPPAGIDGININGPADSPFISVSLSDLLVIDGRIGIQASRVALLDLTDVSSLDNSIDGLAVDTAGRIRIDGGSYDDNSDHGIILSRLTDPVHITNGVSASGNLVDGLEVTSAPRVTIDGGIFSDNLGHGLFFDEISVSTNISLAETTGLVANDNGLSGLRMTRSGTTDIQSGTFDDNGAHGISMALVSDVDMQNVTSTGNAAAGIMVHGGGALLDTDGTFSDNGDHGLQLIDMSANVTLHRTSADDNDSNLDGIGDGLTVGPEDTPYGVGGRLSILGARFRDTDGPLLDKQQIRGVFADLVHDGVYFADSSHTVQSVLASGHVEQGVRVLEGTLAEFSGGSYVSNGLEGIKLEHLPMGVSVIDIDATMNLATGVDIKLAGNISIEDSTLTDNGMHGLEFGASSDLTITGSRLNRNGGHGIHGFDSEDVTINSTEMNDNALAGARLLLVDDVNSTSTTALRNQTGLHFTRALSLSDSDGTYSENGMHGLLMEELTADLRLTRTIADDNDADGDGMGDGLLAVRFEGPLAVGGDLVVLGSKFRDTAAPGGQLHGLVVDGIGGTAQLGASGLITTEASANAMAGGFLIAGTTAEVSDSEFSDNGFRGLEMIEFTDDIQLWNVTAERNGDHGFHAAESDDVTIVGGSFSANSGHGIHTADTLDVVLEDVTANENDPGVLVVKALSFTDTNGTYNGNDDHGVALADIAADVILQGTTANDNDANTDGTGDGVHIATFENVAAVGGDVTLVDVTATKSPTAAQINGVFIESLLGALQVTDTSATGNSADGLSVLTTGASATVSGGVYSSNTLDGIFIATAAEAVSIDGVTANANGDDGLHLLDFQDIAISNVVANDNTGAGVYADQSQALTLDSVRLASNGVGLEVVSATSFSDTGGEYTDNQDHGLLLRSVTADVVLTDTMSNDNDADDDNRGDGLRAFSVGGSLTVTGGTFMDSDGDGPTAHQQSGLHVAEVDGAVSLENVAATGNDVDGVAIEDGGTTATVINSHFLDNDDEGIALRLFLDTVTFDGVTATGNGAEGIELDRIGPIDLRNVTSNDNMNDGLNVSVGRDVSIHDSVFNNNNDDAIEIFEVDDISISSVEANDSGGPLLPLSVGIKASTADSILLSDVTLIGNQLAGAVLAEIPLFTFDGASGKTLDTVSVDAAILTHHRGALLQDPVEYEDVTSLTVTTNDSDDDVTLQLGALPETIHVTGGEQQAEDHLTVLGTMAADSLTLTADTVVGLGTTIHYDQVEDLTIDLGGGDDTVMVDGSHTTILGGAGDDTITVSATGPSPLLLDGQDGNDTYHVDLGGEPGVNLGGMLRIVDTGADPDNHDQATLVGGALADAFLVTPNQVSRGNIDVVAYDANLEELTVQGLAGLDTFDVLPSSDTEYNIDGGSPSRPVFPEPGDQLNFHALGNAVTDVDETLSIGGRADVNYSDIERLEIENGGDVVAPSIVSWSINESMVDPPDLASGPQPTSWSQQRSEIRTIEIQFSEDVALTVDDLVLTNLGVNAPADADLTLVLTADQLTLSGDRAVLTFAVDELLDGVYRLEVADTVQDLSGLALDGDGDGTPGGRFIVNGTSDNGLHQLRGDWNADGGTSIFDFQSFTYWFGELSGVPEYMDLNRDGGVSIFDFPMFASSFGQNIVPPPAKRGILDAKFARPDREVLFEEHDQAIVDIVDEWTRPERTSRHLFD